ncbi:uncharacterized protein LOC131166914 isoform X2 [Malania oleifera]|uniref:uncharacterized protein LOC131166914 isoform X2 n=1 Tax=Malania oleifera TaxID=397392 RepID=UPI0025AE8EC6|nr:uncharacterized protein LOC131166914 isoform X2 [Malania oleifera]
MQSPQAIDCHLSLKKWHTEPERSRKPAVATSLCRERFNFNSSVLRTLGRKFDVKALHKLLRSNDWYRLHRTTSCNSIFNDCIRGFWNCIQLRFFNMTWRCTSRMISVYLLCFNLISEAHIYPSSPLAYACEDVKNYYASVDHLKGKVLKKKLNSIIAAHQSLPYKKVWDALKILDAADVDNPEASSGVVEVYSLRVVSKLLAGKPDGWNREHLWPRSYGLTYSSFTDLHNIRPADVNVNSSRGNKYYGECPLNSTKCLKPANREASSDTETDEERWAPPVKVRGDVARALMYMAVCYGFRQPSGGHILHLSDSPSIGRWDCFLPY